MSSADIVIVILLGVIGGVALMSLFVRSLDHDRLDAPLWIEVSILVSVGLFIYLVVAP